MQTQSQVLDEAFRAVEARITQLRLTRTEFLRDHAGIAYPTYWRCLPGKVTGAAARTKVLRKAEAALERLEGERREKVE